jgi:ABC-type polysaccharide/polyol phosphate transport system ATPase subunit
MNKPDIVIEASNLTKYFYLLNEISGFKAFVTKLLFKQSLYKKFLAVNNLNFHIRRGESIAIVGKNGSGKSTLLYLIAGILKPSSGSIRTKGKMSFILELGTGFHYELSGIDNIYLNGVLLGMKINEVKEKLSDIVAFSELGTHIYRPLKTYSSGMIARLAFSIAVHVEPEILIIDEVLAVGDSFFREKCLKKILSFRENGTTIVLVSHNENDILSLCDRALLLNKGSLEADGKPEEILSLYKRLC